MEIIDRIKSKVTIDHRWCWVWHGAVKNARPNLYVTQGVQFSLPPRPWMRDGKSFNHPIRILKRPPKGRKLIQRCAEFGGSPFCCNPEHWTYPGEVRDEDPRLTRARDLYENCGFSLDDIEEVLSSEIASALQSDEGAKLETARVYYFEHNPSIEAVIVLFGPKVAEQIQKEDF